MSEHPIQGLMDTTLEKIKGMADSNTIIGNPITTAEGTVILPVSKVSFGFASGGSDFPSKSAKDLFGGGSGGGFSVQPVAFLVVKGSSVRLLQLSDKADALDKALSVLPELADKLTDLLGSKKQPEGETETAAE